jgi:Lon protease-like protein
MAAPLIPLFPLGTVLLPGAPLQLHLFEDRYRRLMRDLLELPAGERRFGVIAIRQGREIGDDGVHALHDVGCMAQIVSSQANPDGTYDLECVGTTRFRIVALDTERPYFRGSVEWLPEPAGEASELVGIATARYADYREAIGGIRNLSLDLPELPTDPRLLSYLIAATVIADLTDRQAFLAEYDAAGRLAVESRWLFREATLVRELSSVPAAGMINVPSSVN